jgi:hypothetical protein
MADSVNEVLVLEIANTVCELRHFTRYCLDYNLLTYTEIARA